MCSTPTSSGSFQRPFCRMAGEEAPGDVNESVNQHGNLPIQGGFADVRDHAIALLVLVLVQGPAHSQIAPIGSSTATEDARLNVFLDKAFDEAAALSPQFIANLHLTEYGKLDDYSPAGYDRQLASTRRQFADLKEQLRSRQTR